MILVCLAHIKQHFEITAPALYWLMQTTTRVATPAFLLFSGFVISYLLRTDRRGNAALTLIDRGLFLLIVAHAFLGLADLSQMGVVQWYFGRAEITDVVGIALFMAVFLRAASAHALIAIGTSLCIVSWIIAMTLTLEPEWARLLGSVLFGIHSAERPWAPLPLVPYLGLFLIGMALSLYFENVLLAREHRVIARRLVVFSTAALFVVIVGIVAWRIGKEYLPDVLREPAVANRLRQTLNPSSKVPPSPAYLLFYGGAGLLLLALFFHGRPGWLVQPLMRRAAVIGRASLICFIVQDWLLFVLPKVFGFNNISSVSFWFAYVVVCLFGLYMLAKAWGQVGGNRFLTVGLKVIGRRQSRPVAIAGRVQSVSEAGAHNAL